MNPADHHFPRDYPLTHSPTPPTSPTYMLISEAAPVTPDPDQQVSTRHQNSVQNGGMTNSTDSSNTVIEKNYKK